MELTSIKVTKFKKIRSANFALKNLNILVGANGSGKSSVIQAIHLACCLMRQASEIRANRTSPVNINELDYLPTNTYWELGNGAKWGNRTGTPSSKVSFDFERNDGETITAYSEFRSARNAGISVIGNLPYPTSRLFRPRVNFFSAYIPGISGIPNQEQKLSKRVVLKACSFGDANVYLRNALDLLSDEEIAQIQEWLSELVGDMRIRVKHSGDHDLIIDARVWVNRREQPLELLGMGYLQLIQIFCYILLFNPQILLIDEPDIHLHPNVQEKLSALLSRIASERQFKILLTTHSPFIVRGAPIDASVFWMENGAVQNNSRLSIELALGWGAFGKKIIIVSEDTDTSFLKKLVGQWPDIDKFVTFYPGRGYKNLLTSDEAEELCETLGGMFKVVIHRDGDSLTDEEADGLIENYESEGISLWVTEYSDIEAYFCQTEFLCEFLDCEDDEAEGYVDRILRRQSVDIRRQFNKQRRAHNSEIYEEGGSPTNDEVWEKFQERGLRGAKGKFIFKQLKNRIPNNAFREDKILNHQLEVELASTLRTHLEELLQD